MTRESRVVVDAVARAVSQAVESLGWIRDYLAGLDASVAACRARHDDVECSLCCERGHIADDIRRPAPGCS